MGWVSGPNLHIAQGSCVLIFFSNEQKEKEKILYAFILLSLLSYCLTFLKKIISSSFKTIRDSKD